MLRRVQKSHAFYGVRILLFISATGLERRALYTTGMRNRYGRRNLILGELCSTSTRQRRRALNDRLLLRVDDVLFIY